MWFESFAAVREFAGPDYELAVVPAVARALLAHYDDKAAHYQVKERRLTDTTE